MTLRQKIYSGANAYPRRLLAGSALGLLLFTASVSLIGLPDVARAADDVETAALSPGALRAFDEIALPQPLSDADAAHYRRTFELQDNQRWSEADREIAKLHDRLLLGHVLAQRYLSPKGYHSKFSELSSWLAHYADLPNATRIYHLALSRMPRGAKHPHHPEGGAFSAAAAGEAISTVSEPAHRLNAAEQRHLVELRRAIRHKIDEGSFASAGHLLASRDAQRLFGAAEYDQLDAEIVSGFYFLNQDVEALASADSALPRIKRVNTTVEWAAGMAAWRLKRYDKAAIHFERLATADSADSWSRSAGAYWAARSNLREGVPEKVTHWLEVAANYPYTFYGVLARRLAGKDLDFNWEAPAFTRADASQIMGIPAGKRALALIQVSEDGRAELELRRVNPAQPELAHALLAISQRAEMPALAIQLAQQVTDKNGRRYDAALYPAPSWEPQGGYTVDRALVLALIRQESRFSPRALSQAGARGLMQLMPGTARFVSGGTDYHGRRHRLFDPELNITLGQNYLAHLMGTDYIGDNLFWIVAAYNGGPGNLARWQHNIRHGDDPLVFIESIPNRETRQFVERVLTNYWIYRDQLGLPTTALDAIAEGKWPTYKSTDGTLTPAAANGGN